MGSALLAAYRDYLERMFDASDDLTVVDWFTVPFTVDLHSPTIKEWCDIS